MARTALKKGVAMGQSLDEFEVIGVLKAFVNQTLVGMGALKGASCQIQSIVDGDNDHTVTFLWVDDNGDSHTDTLTILDGEKGEKGDTGLTGNGIAGIAKTSSVGLVDTYTITMTDGSTATFTVTNGDVTVFQGATSEAAGEKGAVPAPEITDAEKKLCGNGAWTDKIITTAQWSEIETRLGIS